MKVGDTLIHNDTVLRLVPVIEVGFCAGCVYEDESSNYCPRNEHNKTICYEEDNADFIFIEDTPEAVAKYIEHRIDPNHEDDHGPNDTDLYA